MAKASTTTSVSGSVVAKHSGMVWMRPARAGSRPTPTDKATLRDWIDAGIRNCSISAESRIVWADEPAEGQGPLSQPESELKDPADASTERATGPSPAGDSIDSTRASQRATGIEGSDCKPKGK